METHVNASDPLAAAILSTALDNALGSVMFVLGGSFAIAGLLCMVFGASSERLQELGFSLLMFAVGLGGPPVMSILVVLTGGSLDDAPRWLAQVVHTILPLGCCAGGIYGLYRYWKASQRTGRQSTEEP